MVGGKIFDVDGAAWGEVFEYLIRNFGVKKKYTRSINCIDIDSY